MRVLRSVLLTLGLTGSWLAASPAARPQVAAPIQSLQARPRLASLLERLEPAPLEELLAQCRPALEVEALLTFEVEPLGDPAWRARKASIEGELQSSRRAGDFEAAFDRALELEELVSQLPSAGALLPGVVAQRELLERVLDLDDAGRARFEAFEREGQQALQLYDEGQYLECTEQLASALETLEEVIPGPNSELQEGLVSLAQLLCQNGQFTQGLTIARAAWVHGKDLVHPAGPESSNLLHVTGSLLDRLGRYEEAFAALARAAELDMRVHGSKSESALVSFNSIGTLLLALGRTSDAERCMRRAADGLEGIAGLSPEILPAALDNHAASLHYLGRVTEARALHTRALALRRERLEPRHPDIATSLLNLGACMEEAGELDSAEACLREAVAILSEQFHGAHPRSSAAHATLAGILQKRGALPQAREHFEIALAMVEESQGPENQSVINLHASLGVVLTHQGLLAEAREHLQRAIAVARTHYGAGSLREGEVLASLGLLEEVSGHGERARESLERALDIQLSNDGADHPRQASLRQNLFDLYLRSGKLERAEHELDEAERVLRLHYGESNPMLVTTGQRSARLALARGDLPRAESELLAALALADRWRTRVGGLERERAQYSERLGHAALADLLAETYVLLGQPGQALQASERGRERVLLDLLLEEHEHAPDATRTGSALAPLVAAAGEARANVNGLEARLELETRVRRDPARQSALEASRAELAKARRALQDAEATLWLQARRSLPAARAVELETLQATLADGELVLSYTWDSELVTLVLVGPDSEQLHGEVLARGHEAVAALEARVHAARESVRDDALEPTLTRQLASLSEVLFPRASSALLAGARRLIVLDAGPLGGLPFELLTAPGADAELLARGCELVYAPSAGVFVERRRARREQLAQAPRARRLIALGSPRFEPESGAPVGVEPASTRTADAQRARVSALEQLRLFGGRLAPLPGSGLEAQRVVELGERAGLETTLLLEDEASLPRLFAELAGARVLHLATHGLSGSRERPYDAGLALSRPERSSGQDDGFLTLERLLRDWRGRLAGCELVVLSACDTRRGVDVGDSSISLSWGFFAAGAPCLLVSLWKVDDAATALLMQRFYESLLGVGEEPRRVGGHSYAQGQALPVGQALAEAKSWLRARSPEQNRRALAALGFELARREQARAADASDSPPLPSAAPTSRAARERFDFSSPACWAAFILVGAPD